VQIGVDGVVLVDAGTEAASDRVVAAIRKLTDLPTRYIINTGRTRITWAATARWPKQGSLFSQARSEMRTSSTP
jgi:hypothetical protein